MACLLSCFVPARPAAPRLSFSVLGARPDSADDSLAITTRREGRIHIASNPELSSCLPGPMSQPLRADNVYWRGSPDHLDDRQDAWIPVDANTTGGAASSMATDEMKTPPRKKAKLDMSIKIVCKVCTNEIAGAYSKPCLRCHQAWCLDCVKTWFTQASQDFERMPARCCNMVMHHGVAGGTLSAMEYDLYKLRYDERTTQNPLYCPVPTCSTFIPPRLLDSGKTTVDCTLCTTRICAKCKQTADVNHDCKESETVAQIKAFKYKTCPRCGTGVMKMFGCPHIRCFCGAHFCWDCERPINVCYRSPCASAREDGQYSEDGDHTSESDEEVEEALGARSTSDTIQDAVVQADNPRTQRLSIMQRVVNIVHAVHRRHSEPQATSPGELIRDVQRYPAGLLQTIQRYSDEPEDLVPRESTAPIASEVGRLAGPSTPPAPQNELSEQVVSHLTEPDAVPTLQCGPYDDLSTSPDIQADADVLMEFLRRFDEDAARENTTLPSTVPRPFPTENEEVNCAAGEACTYMANNYGTNWSYGAQTQQPDDVRPSLPTIALTRTSSAPLQNTSTAQPEVPPVNLDDPDRLNWEGEEYDFGEEPTDESYDVWGCACNFNRLRKQHVDLQHWMQDPKYLECMKCFREITLLDLVAGPDETHGTEKRAVRKMKKVERERLAWHCAKCGLVVCGTCRDEKVGAMKSGMKQNQAIL